MAIVKTSPTNHSFGFTIIEILLVLAIIGGMAAMGIRSFTRQENLKTTVRNISSTLRDVRSFAKLRARTYRLAIDMTDKNQHAFWIESSNNQDLLIPDKDLEEKIQNMNKEDRQKYFEEQGFSIDKSFYKKPKELQSGWYFAQVEVDSMEDPIKDGVAYVYFLSQGVSQEAIIQITNRQKTTWSLHILPVTGGAELYTEAKSLKDFRK